MGEAVVDSRYWTSQSQRLTTRARRSVLAELVIEFIDICHEDRYRFSDVLQAFSDYASGQVSESPTQESIWSPVADVLNLAAQNVLVAFERPAVRNRQAIQRSLTEFIEAVHGGGYTLGDILQALADYCLVQSGKAKKHTWESIASLLELAQLHAEKVSTEIPQPSRQPSSQAIANCQQLTTTSQQVRVLPVSIVAMRIMRVNVNLGLCGRSRSV